MKKNSIYYHSVGRFTENSVRPNFSLHGFLIRVTYRKVGFDGHFSVFEFLGNFEDSNPKKLHQNEN